MKINQDDYSIIVRKFEQLDPFVIVLHGESLEKSEKPPKNLGMRVRWDCFRACFDYIFTNNLYKQGLNDDHIDTALRKVMKEIGLPQFAE